MKVLQAVSPISLSMLLFGSASATSRLLQGENDTAITTGGDINVRITTTPAATDLVSQPADTTVAATKPALTTEEPLQTTEAQEFNNVPTSNSKTLVYNNGDQHTLDPNDLSTKTNIEVTSSSTLFVLTSVSISGYCNDCLFPNSTIDITGSSNLVIQAEDVSIFGSNRSGVVNDAGGSAIELSSKSRAKIWGPILIQGGDGDETAGVGGDAIGLYDESFVEIINDVVLQGGNGVEEGKALRVDIGSTAKIESGTFKSELWVENGTIDVYGGSFDKGVILNGDGASATFNGCFVTSEKGSGGVLNSIELTGSFVNSTETQTINVSLYDGAIVKTQGGYDCADTETTTSSNNTVISNDDAGYVGNTTTYVPTFMPTALKDGNGCIRSTIDMLVAVSLVASLSWFNFV